MKLTPRTGFSLLVLVFFGYLVWEAREWRLQARLYPWSIGIPMIVLALFQLFRELRGGTGEDRSEDAPADFQLTRTVDGATAAKRTANILAWILGFLAGIWLVGFSVTVAAMTFGYLKIQSKEGWGMSLALTAAAWVIYWGLFERTLLLPFPEGAVFRWLGAE